jgi:hypothetical protein
MLFQHPGNCGDSTKKTAVPSKTCAGQNIIHRGVQKIVPLFDDEQYPRADEPAERRCEHNRRSKLRIIAVALEFGTNDPRSRQRRQRHHGAEAIDRDWTELE